MTIPTDFRTQSKTIGGVGITHPIYVFKINLDRLRSELIGPNTNQRDVTQLHPDMYNSSPDRGLASSLIHQRNNIGWLATMFPGVNIDINDDGTITAYGEQANYLKRKFADVANPSLTLINFAPYISADTVAVIIGGVTCGGSAYSTINGHF